MLDQLIGHTKQQPPRIDRRLSHATCFLSVHHGTQAVEVTPVAALQLSGPGEVRGGPRHGASSQGALGGHSADSKGSLTNQFPWKQSMVSVISR